ncbi:MAG TPA: hypothetical protein VKU85_15240 [bacterium]|nr:hypothetical protein [bacterium]
MESRERVLMTAGWLAALVAPARAVDSGRLDLLATEAARLAAAPSPTAASPVPWPWIAALAAGAMAAAFLGTYAGARRQLLRVRGGKDWSELTYRFRSRKPLRLKQDMLSRLNGLLGDLEDIGSDRNRVSGAAAATDDGSAEAGQSPSTPAPMVRFRREGDAVPAGASR